MQEDEGWKDDEEWDGQNGPTGPQNMDTDTQKDTGFTVRLIGMLIESQASTGQLQKSLQSMPATARISQKQLI